MYSYPTNRMSPGVLDNFLVLHVSTHALLNITIHF